MACLTREKCRCYRLHWKFAVGAGPQAGQLMEGSQYLGRSTRAAARSRLRELGAWEEAVKAGRHLPNGDWAGVYELWLREKEFRRTQRTVLRAKRVLTLYVRWREAKKLPCQQISDLACRQDIVRWRDHRLDHEAGRKTVANDLATLSSLFQWCVFGKLLTEHPVDRITRPRSVNKKEGVLLTRQQAGRWLWSIKVRKTLKDRGPRSWEEVRRKRQLAVFLFNTGLRNGELCALSVEDLRVDRDEQLPETSVHGPSRE